MNEAQLADICQDVCNSLLLYASVRKVLRKDEIDAIINVSTDMCNRSLSQHCEDMNAASTAVREAHEKIKSMITTEAQKWEESN